MSNIVLTDLADNSKSFIQDLTDDELNLLVGLGSVCIHIWGVHIHVSW